MLFRSRWPKYWSFSFSIIPSKEIPGLNSFRMDWLDLLAVQGIPKSLLQHWSSDVCSSDLVKAVTDFILLGSKISVVGDCSHEIKRCLLLGRKAMTNLDSVLKSRDVTLPTRACVVKVLVFPVVMYGCRVEL